MQDAGQTFFQMQLDVLKILDPSFLATISMQELYERIFQRKPPIIDGFTQFCAIAVMSVYLRCTVE